MAEICWKLFSSMLVLSGFTFGGGFVIIPLMRRRFSEELGWLTEEELLDMTAFARASPGAVTVNVAVQIGTRMAGPAGALCGVLGTIIPPLTALSIISVCYEALSTSPIVAALLYGLRLAVAIVVADATATMVAEIVRGKNYPQIVVMGCVFVLSLITDVSTVWFLAGSAVLGWFLARRDVS